MNVTNASAALPARWPASASPTPTRACSTAPHDNQTAVLAARMLAAVQRVDDGQRQSARVSAGLEKIKTGLLLMFDPAVALDTPGARALFERGQQARADLATTNDKLRTRRGKLAEQTHRKLVEIEKRIEARKSAGFWSALVSVFKAIATVCATVASACTGNVPGLVGCGLAIGSLVASASGQPGLALGLGIAGGLFCIGGGIMSAVQSASGAASQAAYRVAQVFTFAAGGASGMAAIGAGVKSGHDADALRAEAELAEIKARCKKLLQQVARDEDLMRELLQTVHRVAVKVARLLETDHQGQLAAVAG